MSDGTWNKWEQYYSATSISEALHLLREHPGRARLIAGGTDILIEIERGQRPGIDTLIDVSRIPGLDTITLDGETIRLGALVTHNQVVASDLMRDRALPLAQACWEVGAPQIRNRGTIAGNLITASPANDTITPLVALDAAVTLASLDGEQVVERTVALSTFYQGVRRTVIRPDEMLTAINIPAPGESEHGMFLKLGLRRAQAIAVVNCAVKLSFATDGQTVTRARITLGCVAPTIIRIASAEEALIGKTLNTETIAEAGRLAAVTVKPIDDVRSPAEYRIEMANVLVRRALRLLAAGEERRSWPVNPPLLQGARQEHDRSSSPVQMLSEPLVHDAGTPIRTTINGQPYTLAGGQDKTLLRLLREDAKLPGTKEGCAEGECGACTVYLDGMAVMACMVAAPRVHGAAVTTIEGLSKATKTPDDSPTPDSLHPVQRAFIAANAVQCGYCTPGFIMSGAKLLEEFPHPTREQVMQSITGNLCRCTGYYPIIAAIQNAGQHYD